MGFGVLFVGFLLLLTTPFHEIMIGATGLDIFPSFVGYLMMLYACRRLSPYGKGFRFSVNLLYLLFGIDIIAFAFGIADAKSEAKWVSGAKNIFDFAEAIVLTVFLYVIFSALSKISAEVGKKTLSARAKLGAIVSALYYVIIIALVAFVRGITDNKVFGAFNYLLWIVIFVYDLFQIYGCYMWICYEGEEDMPSKPGKLEKLLSSFSKSADLPEGSKSLGQVKTEKKKINHQKKK